MDITKLHCIDLDQPRLEGFIKFISAWIYQGDNCTLLVDPGPLSSIPVLLEGLERLGVDSLDYILLTHIHIDHAGGQGNCLSLFPQRKSYVIQMA